MLFISLNFWESKFLENIRVLEILKLYNRNLCQFLLQAFEDVNYFRIPCSAFDYSGDFCCFIHFQFHDLQKGNTYFNITLAFTH